MGMGWQEEGISAKPEDEGDREKGERIPVGRDGTPWMPARKTTAPEMGETDTDTRQS